MQTELRSMAHGGILKNRNIINLLTKMPTQEYKLYGKLQIRTMMDLKKQPLVLLEFNLIKYENKSVEEYVKIQTRRYFI